MTATTMDNSERKRSSSEYVIPYRGWWGLVGCAALMGVVLAFGTTSDGSLFGPDLGNFWYYWQLQDATVWTRLSAWVPFVAHTLSIWYLVANARRSKPRYIFGLHSFNVYALALNAFFVLLHVAQTHYFYDGLAQDVHEATSMGSVILMLFLILLMENGRRGLFFGKKVKALTGVGDTVRRYHGYYISWAIIYTFWYHPVELTLGHFAGFAYMMLLLLQSSLFFTRYHTNRWWTMFLETLFVIHGAIVAYFVAQQGQTGPWAMFLFGGVAVFLITQLHGLGLSRKGKLAVAAPLIALMVVFYTFNPEHILGIPRVPAIMYIGTFLMAIIVWVLIRFGRLLQPSEPDTSNA